MHARIPPSCQSSGNALQGASLRADTAENSRLAHHRRPRPNQPVQQHHAVPARISLFNSTTLSRPDWYASASPDQHTTLQLANAEGWRAQNAVDQHLRDVQDLYGFSEPLLQEAIREKHGLDLNVKTTYLNLYIPTQLPWYALDISKGVTTRRVSLLDAALHNFAAG